MTEVRRGRPKGSSNRTLNITMNLGAAIFVHDLCAYALQSQNVNVTDAAPIRMAMSAIARAAPEHLCSNCRERFAVRGTRCHRCATTEERRGAKKAS